MSTLLELVGIALIVAAAYVFAGAGLALLAAGVASLTVALSLEAASRRRK